MDDWGHWDHYVEYHDPRSGIGCRERCLGLATAEAIAEIKRQLGFVRVKIIHRRFSRHKERHSHAMVI
jgi:hypothetical protein